MLHEGEIVEKRLAEMFAQSNQQFQMIHAAARDKLDTNDEAKGWRQVRRWMDRLDRVHDHGRYAACSPSSA